MTAYVETITSTATAAANFNQAQNTVLHTFIATKPMTIRRYGAVAVAAEGLLAAMQLKLRKVPINTGTAADVAGSVLKGAVKARGLGICKTLSAAGQQTVFLPGDSVTIAVEVSAGATSTGTVWIEAVPLTWQTAEIDNMVESAL